MFYAESDRLLPEACARPTSRRRILPAPVRADINAMNEWVYDKINKGVYNTGYATTWEAYQANLYPLSEVLDRVKEHLGQPGHQPYLFGGNTNEVDVRLYTDDCSLRCGMLPDFGCNLRMISHDYPRIDRWYRRLY